jgi:hypothetical protein
VIERLTAQAAGLPAVTQRTLRTNLRSLAGRAVPQLAPADAPLPRKRAKRPYSFAEIGGYLALADAQQRACGGVGGLGRADRSTAPRGEEGVWEPAACEPGAARAALK